MSSQEAAAGAGGAAGALLAYSDELAQLIERVGQSVVRVDARRRQSGSGVLWAGGLVVTADHVLERDEDVSVGLADGRTVPATVAGRDPGTDLALLRVEGAGGPAIARAAAPRTGQLALVVARPGRLAATMGLVSAVGGPIRTWRGGRLEGVIWTDAALYPGFSGAPLVDASGGMLGVVTTQFGRGAGLAIPLATVERIMAALQAHGRIRRGFLGIHSQVVAIPDGLRTRLGLAQDTGLLVVGVERGGPAERGGVLIGDVLIALDQQPIRSTDDLVGVLGPERVGQETPLRVIRGGEIREVRVTIGERA